MAAAVVSAAASAVAAVAAVAAGSIAVIGGLGRGRKRDSTELEQQDCPHASPSQPGEEQPGGASKRRRLSFNNTLTGKHPGATLRLPVSKKAKSATPQTGVTNASAVGSPGGLAKGSSPLMDALGSGIYFDIASWLDVGDLKQMDAACRTFRTANGSPTGPWKSLGEQVFYGMELDAGGGFLAFQQPKDAASTFVPVPVSGRTSWKAKYEFFNKGVPTFSAPFNGREILAVDHPDEVAYCRCRLRADLLVAGGHPAEPSSSSKKTGGLIQRRVVALPPVNPSPDEQGVYVEVDVKENADNLSLAVVDFEGGGRSSVTFSPETGAVLRERKVREVPRAIEGTYIHLLEAAPHGRKFEGTMGLYLSKNGHLAFFRRWSRPLPASNGFAQGGANLSPHEALLNATTTVTPASSPSSSSGSARNVEVIDLEAPTPVASPVWETTGFCTDLTWAQGPRLSLCLAFRDNGDYKVRISKVARTPPMPVGRSPDAYQEGTWNLLYGDDDHPLAI